MLPRRHSTLKLDWRCGIVVFGCTYLAGVVTGSFFCGMLALNNDTMASVNMYYPSNVLQKQNVRRDDTATITGSKKKTKKSQDDTSTGIIPLVNATTDERNHRLDDSTESSRKLLLTPKDLKLPTPILVMGLMKAGTTSIYGFFHCGLDPHTSRLSHYDCKPQGSTNPEKIGMACGKRMRRNLTKFHKAAFDTIDNFTLYAELDAQENNGGMTLPQWDYLDPIYQQFPNATWILNLRDPQKWLDSVNRWKDLRQRFVDNAYLPDLPRGKGEDDQDMIQFYKQQAQRIRDFVRDHPSLSLVEIQIDNPDAGRIMEDAFGISKSCWRTRNVNNGTAVWTVE